MKANRRVTMVIITAFLMVFSMIILGSRPAAANEAEPCINYTILGSSNLETPQSQTVVVSIGDIGKSRLSSAVLTYTNRSTKERYEVSAGKIYKDTALFTMDFFDDEWKGNYELTKISCIYQGESREILYKDTGKSVKFAVNGNLKAAPDAVIEGMVQKEEEQVVSVEVTDLKAGVKGALSSASQEIPAVSAANPKGKSKSSDKKVIVLDPGHGGSDPGAIGNGLQEKNLTLKIASYCKEELETYNDVKIYMTRSSDVYVGLTERVNYAASVGADAFVSIHINSSTNSSAHGAEVYYPNGNYNPSAAATGRNLASAIEKNLVALGLANRGIQIRNSETGNTYADGSAADYYAVIRGAKQAGIPGIIVEHAFISNSGDAGNYLSSDAALKKLGVADAQGIADTFGLTKGDVAKTTITKLVSKQSSFVNIKWKKIKGASGYEIYRSKSENKGYKKIATITERSTLSYRDESVKPGKTYYYKIRGYKNKDDGEVEKGEFCSASGVNVLKKPGSLSGSSSNSQVKLKWKKVKGAGQYEIYRSTSPEGTYKKINTVKNGSNTYVDKSAKKGKTYYYKIRAAAKGTGGTSYSDYGKVKKVKVKK